MNEIFKYLAQINNTTIANNQFMQAIEARLFAIEEALKIDPEIIESINPTTNSSDIPTV